MLIAEDEFYPLRTSAYLRWQTDTQRNTYGYIWNEICTIEAQKKHIFGPRANMPRPNVPDRLIEEVESLHEERREYEAGSFQEALATVTEMATPKLVEETALLVGQGYPEDKGQNTVRLHQDTFQQLDVPPGMPIEITGEQTTVASTKPMKKADRNPETIRMNGFVRENAGVDKGECVRVQRFVGGPDADAVTFKRTTPDEVTVELPETDIDDLGAEAREVIHRQVQDRLLTFGDVVPVRPDDGGKAVLLTVADTTPEAPIYVTDSTELAINESDQA